MVDYQYNELNQLINKKEGSESYTYTYDKRGNRIEETGKKESRSYLYDETNIPRPLMPERFMPAIM